MPGVSQRNNREHNRSRPKEKHGIKEIFPKKVGKPEHKTGRITRKGERRLDSDDREELFMNNETKKERIKKNREKIRSLKERGIKGYRVTKKTDGCWLIQPIHE